MQVVSEIRGWGYGGFGETAFGSGDADVQVLLSALPRVSFEQGGTNLSFSAGATNILSGSAVVAALGLVLPSGDSFLSIQGSKHSFSGSQLLATAGAANALLIGNQINASLSNFANLTGTAEAQITGSLVRLEIAYAGPEVITIAAQEFAELFWNDPRALTVSKYLIGGGGGVPTATGDTRRLLDLILSHPKALTSAKLLALGD